MRYTKKQEKELFFYKKKTFGDFVLHKASWSAIKFAQLFFKQF
jgi:hypothetical protein